MSQAHDAADAIRRLAKQFENMAYAADVLEKIGSLDNATAEAGRARLEAETLRDAALAAKAEAEAGLTAVKAQADQIVETAREAAAGVVRQAENVGQGKVADATAQAELVVREANIQARKIVDDAIREKNTAALETQALREEHEQLAGAVMASRAEAEAIEARLISARAEIAKLLG